MVIRSLRSFAVRAGSALTSLDAVLEEAIVWQFVFNLADQLQHFLVVKLRLPGQNPQEVERGQAIDIAARVDDAVSLVVCVQNSIVGLIAGRRSVSTEGYNERGITGVCWNCNAFDA